MEPSNPPKLPSPEEIIARVEPHFVSVDSIEEAKSTSNKMETKSVKSEDAEMRFPRTPSFGDRWKSFVFPSDHLLNNSKYFYSYLLKGKMFIVPKKYKILQALGQGSYGIVWKAQDTEANEDVAIKKILNPFKFPESIIRILREVRLLKFLNHENIIQIKDLFPSVSLKALESIYVTTEFMSSDLMQIINSNNPMEEEQITFILFQILSALKYLHSANILHRDLKPSNILINEDWEIKLCDFGLARAINENEQSSKDLTMYVTTRIYRAPELLFLIGEYTQAIDVWSVGCIFAEMLIRKPLFAWSNHIKIAQKIYNLVGSLEGIEDTQFKAQMDFFKKFEEQKDESQSFDKMFGSFSDQTRDLLRKMLIIDPKKRISIDDALRHPYFEDYEDDLAELEDCNKKFDWEFETLGSDPKKLKQEVVNEIFSFSKNIDEEQYIQQTNEYKALKKSHQVHHFISFAKN